MVTHHVKFCSDVIFTFNSTRSLHSEHISGHLLTCKTTLYERWRVPNQYLLKISFYTRKEKLSLHAIALFQFRQISGTNTTFLQLYNLHSASSSFLAQIKLSISFKLFQNSLPLGKVTTDRILMYILLKPYLWILYTYFMTTKTKLILSTKTRTRGQNWGIAG